jgi:hypothetical protein
VDSSNTRFNVTFDPQSVFGNYMLTVGPNIMDRSDTYLVPVFHSQLTITNDLIVNGGFETQNFSGWTQWGDTGYSGVSSGIAHDGNYAAYFGPRGGLGGIMQTVNTTPGQTYQFSFWLSHPYAGSTPNEFQVQLGSTTLDDQRNVGLFNYTQNTNTYTPTASTTTVRLGFSDAHNFFFLDDVSLTPVRAPHGGPGSANVLVSNFLSGNATALIQNPGPAPLSGSGLGTFGVPGQQQAILIGVGGQVGPPINLGAGAVDNRGKFDPPTIATVARADTLAYHGLAASVLFSDPLLGDLFRDVI